MALPVEPWGSVPSWIEALGDAGVVFRMDAGRLSVYGLNGSERMAFLRLFGGWFLSLRLQLSYMVGIEGFRLTAL